MTCSTLDAAEDARQLAHQVQLARRAGGEVGVPAFRRAPARSARRRCAAALRRARCRRRSRAALPSASATPSCRTASSSGSSTDTAYASASRSFSSARVEAERLGHHRAVHAPRHVGQPRDLAGDGAGDAEARRVDPARLEAPRLRGTPRSSARGRRSRASRTRRRRPRAGRSGAAAKSPSSVFVPPMSPASSMATIVTPGSGREREFGVGHERDGAPPL